jgi:hypothetical protein
MNDFAEDQSAQHTHFDALEYAALEADGRLYGTRYCTTRQRFDLPGTLTEL